jgi:hypothetical protein
MCRAALTFSSKNKTHRSMELVETTNVKHCTPSWTLDCKSKSPRIAPGAGSDFGAATG